MHDEPHHDGHAEQLQQAMGGGPISTSRDAARTPRMGGRTRLLDEGTIERVYEVVRSSPGLRSQQVMKQVPYAPKLVKLALAKLRADKRIKMQGQKRGATYTA
jgi:hypothetical protein